MNRARPSDPVLFPTSGPSRCLPRVYPRHRSNQKSNSAPRIGTHTTTFLYLAQVSVGSSQPQCRYLRPGFSLPTCLIPSWLHQPHLLRGSDHRSPEPKLAFLSRIVSHSQKSLIMAPFARLLRSSNKPAGMVALLLLVTWLTAWLTLTNVFATLDAETAIAAGLNHLSSEIFSLYMLLRPLLSRLMSPCELSARYPCGDTPARTYPSTST